MPVRSPIGRPGANVTGVAPAGVPGTYSRTSTEQIKAGAGGVYAPSLRDVVSILDFVDAADVSNHGNGTTDDTALIRSAAQAVATVGGTLVMTPHRMDGSRATWTLDAGTAGPATIFSNLTISAYGAQFQALPGGNHELFGVPYNTTPTTAVQISNFRFFGGTFIGTGAEGVNQIPIQVHRGADITVRDTTTTNWGTTNGTGVIYLADVQRARIEGNVARNCTAALGYGCFVLTVSAQGSATTPWNDALVRGNTVLGNNSAGIDITLGTPATYVPADIHAIVSNNNVEAVAGQGILVEIGGNPPGSGVIHGVTIGHNHVRSSVTSGSAYPITILNDSAPLSTDGTIFQDIAIIGNQVSSTWNGIKCQASRALIAGNIVSAANIGINCAAPTVGSSTISHVHVKGIVHMADGGAGSGVTFNSVTDGSIDCDVFFDTGATGTAVGVILTGCTRMEVAAKVNLAPTRAIRITNGGDITILSSTRIYNPSSAGSFAGIRVDGTLTDNVTVNMARVVDDRGGSAAMTYAIENAATGANVIASNCTLKGFVTARYSGTVIGEDNWNLVSSLAVGGGLIASTQALAVNEARGGRIQVPRTGKIIAMYAIFAVASGNVDAGIYSSDAAAPYSRLWSSGSQACPSTTGSWQSLGAPNINVVKGQMLDLAIAADNATMTVASTNASGQGGQYILPSGALNAGRLNWNVGTSFPLPNPISPSGSPAKALALAVVIA